LKWALRYSPTPWRTAAKKVQRGEVVRKALEDRGIVVRCASLGELAEEAAPHAYKDVDRVVNVVHEAGLARKVAMGSVGLV
jgi:tRNA-splicing ligase RtcB (3'-phosphate/5'-hydroxy nucleic acid ligase)